jgi:hypothetical protein
MDSSNFFSAKSLLPSAFSASAMVRDLEGYMVSGELLQYVNAQAAGGVVQKYVWRRS